MAQNFLFEVCDNNFQGPPQSHPACMPDGVCEDEDIDSSGAIQVTLTFADDYWVVESKAPPGFVADPAKKMCPVVCKLLFVNQPEPGLGGVAELPDVTETPLEAPDSSATNTGLLAAIAAGATAFVALGAAAWYARRRLTS